MTSPVRVILNPAAGGGSGLRLRAEIERELARRDLGCVIALTRAPGDGVALARQAVEAGVGAVVAAGGDGTVHEVANGILQALEEGVTPPPLGVIPVGTGNDFVKLLGGADRRRSYDRLAAGMVRHFDVGLATWKDGREYFINGAGTGVDVEVVRQKDRLPRLPGVLKYLVAAVRALATFDPIPLRLRVDGKRMDETIHMIAVGNGVCIGGGFYITPDAVPDDGRFDLCIVPGATLGRIALILPRVMRGTHTNLPDVRMLGARVIEIEALSKDPLFFQLDGELREPRGARRLRVEIRPGVLPVLTDGTARGPRPPAGGAA